MSGRSAWLLPARPDALFNLFRAGENHLALVCEVVEEGPPVQAGSLGDLSDRRVLEPLFREQLQRRLPKAPVRVGFPSDHTPSIQPLHSVAST